MWPPPSATTCTTTAADLVGAVLGVAVALLLLLAGTLAAVELLLVRWMS